MPEENLAYYPHTLLNSKGPAVGRNKMDWDDGLLVTSYSNQLGAILFIERFDKDIGNVFDGLTAYGPIFRRAAD